MIVWTNQPYSVYEQLMATGSFSCTPALSSMAKQKAGGLAPLIPLIAEQHILPEHSTTTWLVITANIVTQPQEHQLIMR